MKRTPYCTAVNLMAETFSPRLMLLETICFRLRIPRVPFPNLSQAIRMGTEVPISFWQLTIGYSLATSFPCFLLSSPLPEDDQAVETAPPQSPNCPRPVTAR